MKILIANNDYQEDPHSISWTRRVGFIRQHNIEGYGKMYIFDPYEDKEKSSLGSADLVFDYIRNEVGCGVIGQFYISKDVYTDEEGYREIECRIQFEVDPTYMPFLSQETLVAYMPHIPWDEFGNHMYLEDEDAEQFYALWKTFIKQNKDLFNAVYRQEYPLDDRRGVLSYIFMEKEIE